MEVVILSGQQEIGNLSHYWYLRQGNVMTILAETTDTAILDGIEVTNGQWRCRVDVLDTSVEAWMYLLDEREECVSLVCFPLKIILTPIIPITRAILTISSATDSLMIMIQILSY